MYQASFIFRPGEIDQEFHERNEEIGARARSIPGFLSEESWQSKDGQLRQATYFWSTKEALQKFMRDSSHTEAKSRQARWYLGYHVIISEIIDTYGDGRLDHVTGDSRRARLQNRS